MTVTPHAGQVGHGRRRRRPARSGASPGPVVVARGLDRVRLYNVVRVGRGGAARRGHPARAASWPRSRSMRTPADCASVSRCSTPAARWRSSSGPGCSGASSTAPSDRWKCSPAPATTRSAARCSPRGADLPRSIVSGPGRSSRASPRVTASVAGDILGVVAETTALEHRILVPPHVCGVVTEVGSGPREAGGAGRVDRRPAGDHAEPMAGARSTAGRRPAGRVDAADHGPAGDRRSLPDRPRRRRNDPRRLRDREDRAAAVPGEMGACRRRRVRRLR